MKLQNVAERNYSVFYDLVEITPSFHCKQYLDGDLSITSICERVCISCNIYGRLQAKRQKWNIFVPFHIVFFFLGFLFCLLLHAGLLLATFYLAMQGIVNLWQRGERALGKIVDESCNLSAAGTR